MSPTIRPAAAADLPATKMLLEHAGLPVTDLESDHLAFVAESGAELVGAIGVESLGDVGLLRSLVVDANARAAGIGRELVVALEGHAGANGIAELWLLTLDADPYFERLGYRVRDRDDAPEPIRGTAEFSSLCPGSAVLMSKQM